MFRAKTLRKLADDVGASPAFLSSIERGEAKLTGTLLKAVSLVLGFEEGFFARSIAEEFTERECTFRRPSKNTKRLQKQILAKGTLLALVVEYLQERLKLPRYNVPDCSASSADDIERAAELCRTTWNLGLETPIVSMSRVLEHAGVWLMALRGAESEVDSFSRSGVVSLVAINMDKSASRCRFDMARGLGHLVLHRNSRLPHDKKADEAKIFAAAFLLPKEQFSRAFWSRGRIDWDRAYYLKKRFKVSFQSIVIHAHQLGLLDAVQYRRAYKVMASRGWIQHEPLEPDPESPELLGICFAALAQDGESSADIARHLGFAPPTLAEVTGVDPIDAASTVEPQDPGVISLHHYLREKGPEIRAAK